MHNIFIFFEKTEIINTLIYIIYIILLTNTKMGNSKSVEKYSACHRYVKAVEDLPPTYDISDKAGTNPIPDPNFYNRKILETKFNEVEKARQNVIDKCGFDPSRSFNKW